MNVFRYDKTLEGLLTCVFDAYDLKIWPDELLASGAPLPLFCDNVIDIVTDTQKSDRVWKGLQKKMQPAPLRSLAQCICADRDPKADITMFRYIRKTFDSPKPIETDFRDPDVLEILRISKRVSYETLRVKQFMRFQKAADGTYFGAFAPDNDVIGLAIEHFKDRFADQPFIIYDTRRQYGFYYDKTECQQITFTEEQQHAITGFLSEDLMAEDEKLFQKLWKTYFNAICIRERLNLRKHKQDMPVRYWKYLIEKH
ncbi:MAG: TIGR03915 family putative DNA repair protein [Bacteroidales bacterium]|nr:TIGR03915 family putative DNA repair protein [Bacteroidales bacterium]